MNRRSAALCLVGLLGWFLLGSTCRADFIYVSTNDAVIQVDPAANTTVVASGFSRPRGLAFDSSGNLFVAELLTDTIRKISPGGSVSIFASGISHPVGLAFDSAGNLYVANNGPPINAITKITPGGVASFFVPPGAGLDNPSGLDFDSAGNLYVSNANGIINKITPGGSMSVFVSGFPTFDLQGIAFDSAGNLFVAQTVSSLISRVTPGGMVSTFADTHSPWGLAFESSGNLLVANASDILKITPGGSISVFASGFDGDTDITTGPQLIQGVPEPSSLVLFGIGIAGIIAYRARRAKQTRHE